MKKGKKKESKPKRFDPIRPNKDVIDMSINGGDSNIKRVKSVKYQILEQMEVETEYIASRVGKAFHITRRRALEKLTELEDEGLVKSIYDLCSFEDGKGGTTVAKARIFSKI
jgi:D-ribose pyranose/furanose isomerase RbsD